MTPLVLTMQAFGPFASRQQVDFSAMGQNPLFLINGPTGAGKTSILDAICVALYGKTTGNEREAAQMRCDQASDRLTTEVSLSFRLGDKCYRVLRRPTQEVAKARGEGTTTRQAEAFLYLQDGSDEGQLLAGKKVTEVDSHIHSLLGLKVEQFRQVMVLPQGQFRALLLADSKQREAIFSQLFQTQIYRRIEHAIKDRASDIRRAVEGYNNQIKGILAGVQLTDEEALILELRELAASCQAQAAQKQAAQQALNTQREQYQLASQINEQFTLLVSRQKQLHTLEASRSQIDAASLLVERARRALMILPAYRARQTAVQSHADLSAREAEGSREQRQMEAALATAQATFAKAHQQYQGLPNKREALVGLKQQFTWQQQLAERQRALDEQHGKVLAINADYEEKQRRHQALEARLLELETSQQSLRLALDGLADARVEAQRMEAMVEKRRELEALRDAHRTLLEQRKLATKKLEDAEADYQQQRRSRTQTEMAWHQGQAAVLALTLETKMPCPVCGSKVHPQPAEADAATVTDASLEQARIHESEAQDRLNQCSLTLSELSRAMEENAALGKRLSGALGNYASEPLSGVEQRFTALKDQLKGLTEQQRNLGQVVDELDTLKQQRQVESEGLQRAQMQLQQCKEALAKLEAKRDEANAQLPERAMGSKELQQAIAELEQQIQTITDNQSQSQQALDAANQDAARANARLTSLVEQMAEQQGLLQQTEQAWHEARISQGFSDDNDFSAACLDEYTLKQHETRIRDFHHSLGTLSGSINELTEALKDKSPQDMAPLEARLGELKHAYEQQEKAWLNLYARQQSLCQTQEQLAIARQQHAALEQEYAIYGTLDEVASGKRGERVSLQRFVLGVLLDDVLSQASERLYMMSRGRYRLIRQQQRSKGNQASGLDLLVDDAYSGKARPVSTLSGGESFMAALALALGVSDVVQAHAGGIRLDTLFIDEGFGSLDADSLELAIRTLTDLQAAGRMIGIISHVSELKEQMARRIEVTSGIQGSSVSMGL